MPYYKAQKDTFPGGANPMWKERDACHLSKGVNSRVVSLYTCSLYSILLLQDTSFDILLDTSLNKHFYAVHKMFFHGMSNSSLNHLKSFLKYIPW